MVGTIEGRKNHWLILNVWRDLIELLGEKCPKLILVGKRGWECEQVFAMLDRSVQLRDYVIELGGCDDEQLLYLLSRTQALLFPSNVEGFGLPLIEALAMQVPVIASNIPVFNEISFNVVELLSPIDGIAWRNKIIEYMSPDIEIRLRKLLQIAQAQERLPTWEKHFEVIAPIVQEIVRLSK